MFRGIAENYGKNISASDAFSYALERVFSNKKDTHEFCEAFPQFNIKILADDYQLEEFKHDLVEWFYSGNWVHKNEESDDEL